MNGILKELKIWMLILASVFVAIAVSFLHLSNFFEWLRPQLTLIVIMYWALIAPERMNVYVVWFGGFLFDILYSTPIGTNSLVLVTIVYFVARFSANIKLLDFWQLGAVIFGLAVIYQIILFVTQISFGGYINLGIILSRAVISALMWPLVVFLLSYSRKKTHLESVY